MDVPESHKFGEAERPWWSKLWKLQRKPDGSLRLTKIEPAESADAFAADLRSAIGELGPDENRALVYLHGYNTSFREAAIRAAQLATDINPPGLTAFFSWPSHARVKRYAGDAERAEASERFFIEFLQVLVDRAGIERVDLLVHSMGNQAFARSVRRMVLDAATKHIHFGVIMLAAPDIDPTLFHQIAPEYCNAADKATMYVSTKDIALKASKYIHSGPRAGYCPPVTIAAGIDTVEVSDIDFSRLGHGYYADAAPLLVDMRFLIDGQLDPRHRMRLTSTATGSGEAYWRFYA
ncbi:alpha/beta hydrolase [Microbacterium sp. ASV49]|uniref:Alpha/beta hydrolase n=1 Tax=Microbacterium candidum TaxID=3041922 RepID=A0ABT7N046_9MICO|nr:alpha/beta hydrolase [Microbacterium sp. ASV49]MDL9980079.1 alpha/beta hydrolase [Microbacterium sp. ASV49]